MIHSRKSMLRLVLALLVVGTVAWTYHWYATQRNLALRSAADLATTRGLAQRINRLTQRKAVIRAERMQDTEMAQRIEAALHTAGVDLAELVRIDPESPRPMGDSDYHRVATNVTLGRVTLPQFVHLLHTLVTRGEDMQLANLHLRAPHDEPANDTWRAEFRLTYLLYAPDSPEEALVGELP